MLIVLQQEATKDIFLTCLGRVLVYREGTGYWINCRSRCDRFFASAISQANSFNLSNVKWLLKLGVLIV